MKAILFIHWWLMTSFLYRPDPQPRQESAVLFVYRQREFGGNAYSIRLNGKQVGSLAPNRYLKLTVLPGHIKIESAKDYFSENQSVSLVVQPGKMYYVKAVEDIDFMTRTLLLAQVSDEQARQELRRVKPIEIAPSAQKD